MSLALSRDECKSRDVYRLLKNQFLILFFSHSKIKPTTTATATTKKKASRHLLFMNYLLRVRERNYINVSNGVGVYMCVYVNEMLEKRRATFSYIDMTLSIRIYIYINRIVQSSDVYFACDGRSKF